MKHAFSLVELSIVLVILGLLTGGILTGQSLIRAAELRSVTTEFQNYQTAVMTFRDKYLSLPGDMPNAERFWEAMSSGSCPNATGGVGKETCSGDGNSQINPAAAPEQSGEMFTFWQHLANAGLIEGSYSGLAGDSSGGKALVGDNVPKSKLGQAGWSTRFMGSVSASDTAYFEGNYSHVFWFGRSSGTGPPDGAELAPEELWGIDKKIDDGLSTQGVVRSLKSRSLCYDGNNYNLDNANFDCTGFMKAAF